MTKTFFIITAIFVTFFFVQCNNPKQKENPISDKKAEKDSCCVKNNIISSTKKSTESEITCPKCNHKKTETLPTDICLIKYTCDNCRAVLYAKDGDCCVFCSYGTHKCPSRQED